MHKLLTCFALAAAFAAPAALHANTLNGQFSIDGTVQNIGSTLYFDDPTITVGSANTLTGSFSSLLTPGEHLTAGTPIAPSALFGGDFTTMIPYSPYTGGVSLTWTTQGGGTLTGVIQTLTETTVGPDYIFNGTGLLTATGFDPTSASFNFTTQASGPVTFSATTIASPVPEPSSLALFGTGVLGLAGLVSKKFLA